jgi:hypothetical protein
VSPPCCLPQLDALLTPKTAGPQHGPADATWHAPRMLPPLELCACCVFSSLPLFAYFKRKQTTPQNKSKTNPLCLLQVTRDGLLLFAYFR